MHLLKIYINLLLNSIPLTQSCMHSKHFRQAVQEREVCGQTCSDFSLDQTEPLFSSLETAVPFTSAIMSFQNMNFQCVFAHFVFNYCECVYVCVPLQPSTPIHKRHHWSFVPSFRCLFRASERVTVYSNQRMLGIRLVSRTRKYSDSGQAAILGNNGVSTSCVKKNQITLIVQPATPP